MTASAEGRAAALAAAVQARRDQLLATSHYIHAHPEVRFTEHLASARLAEELQAGGFTVELGVGTLPTAFRAELRGAAPGPTVAILAEYDALPEIGHACGHNIIASSALGAGLALAQAGGPFAGTVLVLGTPAEEGGGGKVILAENGLFDDVDAAIMVHPSQHNMVSRGSLAHSFVEIVFHGRASHAAAAPDQGVNALEAVMMTFAGLNARRLHMRSDARVHGFINNGGSAVNIIPGLASARFSVRAKDRAYQRELVEILTAVARGAETMIGARLELNETRGYEHMVSNEAIASVMGRHLQNLGRSITPPTSEDRLGSTDMGDISQLMPAVHAYLAIAPQGVANHTIEFTALAGSEVGDTAVMDGATSLAQTALDVLTSPGLLEQAKAEYEAQRERGTVAGRAAWLEHGKQFAPVNRNI
ncbi:MAG: M20 family metallopeptidase [Chloroflexota bacterium]